MIKKLSLLCLMATVLLSFGCDRNKMKDEVTTMENEISRSAMSSNLLLEEAPEWVPNSKYEVGDRVLYEGKIYMCKVGHARLKPTTKYAWDYLGVYEGIPQWKANSTYQVGDKVVYEGKIYICKVAHRRLKPTTKYAWDYLRDLLEIPEWIRGTKYVVGDKVKYNGDTYICKVDHVRLAPTTAYVWDKI